MKHVRPNVSQFAAQWTQAQPITEPEKPKLKPRPRRRNRIPILETPDLPHEEREADENVSVEAVNDGKRAAENVACFVNDAGYRRNVRAYRKEIRETRPDNGRVKPPGQPAAAFDGFPSSSGWKMPAGKAATENRQTLHTCGRMQQESNPLSKAHQKQHMKQAFLARAREQKVAGAAVENIPEVLRRFLPKLGERQVHLFPVALVCSLLLFMTGGLSSFMPLGEAISHAFIIGTYPAEEADVLAAERAYCEMEKELEDELDHYEARHPGCDEYNVKAQEIWHDPYALCAIISAYLGGEEWTIDSAYPVMERYFKLQYVLTEKITTETRYRTEQRVGQQLVTDPKTGAQRWESYTYEVEVPYTYRICDVKLENKNLSHQPVYSMSREKMGLYALYMSTLGNMPDLFAGKPHASQLKDPLLYDVPKEYKQADPQFGKLIEEAEKYLGFPYVWGGSSPDTSFDCSGFVSYVFTNSGVYNTGRLGATGLYGICQKITADEARPGDLIFFEGTMGEDVGGITHVGLYVGDNMMIHCGNPITYADLTRSYWQQHFYGFGRIPYDP